MSDNPAALARLASKSTLTGLRQRLDHSFTQPSALTRSEYESLAPTEQEAYDDARLEWFGAGMWVRTPTIRRLMTTARAAMRTSHILSTGEKGIVLTGPAHTGKSTGLMRLAAATEAKAAKQNPHYRTEGCVPVVHIDIQAKSTPKSVASHIVEFFEVPFNIRTSTQYQLINQAIRLLQAHRAEVLIIDELQMLRLDGKTGDDAINTLKNIMNEAGVLCVFAGIDITKELSSKAAEQIMARCETIEIQPHSAWSEASRTEWHQLVDGFGGTMGLLDAEPGHLAPFADMLLEASAGSIGNLRRILSIAMEAAVSEKHEHGGPEVITAELLFGHAPQAKPTVASAARKSS